MEFKSIILDSSVIISYFWPQDSNHENARRLFQYLDVYQNIFITNLITLEIATVLSQRIGKSKLKVVTNDFVNSLDNLFVNEQDTGKVLSQFLEIKDKNISFIDLSTSYIAKKHKIDTVLTFDKHFKRLGKDYGFNVLGC